MRRRAALLASLLAVVVAALPATGAAQTRADGSLQRKLARALAVPHVPQAGAAALAVELGTGRAVFTRKSSTPVAPASTEKLPVTYAALAVLGPTFRIETDVLGEGEQVGSVWRGDLVLQGHGDPTLSSAGLRRLSAQSYPSPQSIAGAPILESSEFQTP